MTAKRQTKDSVKMEYPESPVRKSHVLIAILFFGLAVLFAYITLAAPEAGTAMEKLQMVLSGLGGHLSIVFALIMAWIGLLAAFSAAGKHVSILNACLDGILFLCLFTGVQLFFAEKVIQNRMTIMTFANFVNKSYGYRSGGGAVGAVLAWPLYQMLGKWGGLLVVLLVAVLSLAASGKLGKFIHWAGRRSEEIQYSTQQHRMERDNERMFKVEEPRKSMFIPNRDEKAENSRASEGKYDETEIDRHRNGEEAAVTETQTPRPRKNTRRSEASANPSSTVKGELCRTENEDKRNAQKKGSRNQSSANEDAMEISNHNRNISADNDGPTMAAFDGSKRRKRERMQPQPDRPEFLKEEKKTPPKQDLTIEPDESDVLENDKPEPKPKMQKMKRVKVTEPEEENGYNYPPIDLLENGERIQENYGDSDMEKAHLLEETLNEFGISTKLTGIAHGPAVTRFELQPAPGVKLSRITNLSDDIAMHLAAMSVRIEAPIPGKAAVGVEIPNDKVEVVRLRDVLESPEARKSASKIAVGLGKDNSGRYIVADIAKMPHVLIAGQTGSGKSVCINSIITSILFRATPEEVRLILIDPKVVELSIYNGIPHLVCPVVTDCKKASSALQWAVSEMTMRYKRFAERGVRDIKGYNKALKPDEKPMPQMVIIIDELADLMMVAPGEVEDSICRLAQLARAAGMHLVIATQRPSVNVITGIIKANIPTRIAFSVASQIDSRTMIDHGGAEKLLGNGDMLFVPSGINKPMRVQGAWVSDEEVHAITQYIKERSETTYDADMIEQMDNATRSDAEREEVAAEYDVKLPEAVEIVVEAGQASVSMLQRRMRIGYARAGRLIDEMERRGIVSEADGSKPRSVLITREQLNDLFEDE